jgi:hypothetical protein
VAHLERLDTLQPFGHEGGPRRIRINHENSHSRQLGLGFPATH